MKVALWRKKQGKELRRTDPLANPLAHLRLDKHRDLDEITPEEYAEKRRVRKAQRAARRTMRTHKK